MSFNMNGTSVVNNDVLIEVNGLKKYYPVNKGVFFQRAAGYVKAVDDVSFRVERGETLGLVGESGCGKTTVGRTMLQLERPTSGEVLLEGEDLCQLDKQHLRRMRRKAQMIFQNPFASLNPRININGIINEPLQVHNILDKKDRQGRVQQLLKDVGLNPTFINRYPHELSGGQRQRVAIARALAAEPEFIVCDEPVSALDVSVQAQIINLLTELQAKFSLTYLFIAHDLAVVRHISNRIAVMYLGKIVEIAHRSELYNNPLHPYTKALLSAVPLPDPEVEAKRDRTILTGDVPSPLNPPQGCSFHTRCPAVMEKCSQVQPNLEAFTKGHYVSCHLLQPVQSYR
jgi:oligopeptide transport system ATP-binding protein